MTEMNNPNDILRVVLSSLFILSIIRADIIVIKTNILDKQIFLIIVNLLQLENNLIFYNYS